MAESETQESSTKTDNGQTHFGFKQVALADKQQHVGQVFHSVAEKYDLMNDAMSLGLARVFRRFLLELSGVRKGQRVLDLAGGTGDFSRLYSEIVGSTGSVVLADINASMLSVGRDRLLNKGVTGVSILQTNGEFLPFEDDSFDCATIGYGIRNFTDKQKALADLYRILKPGGRLLILEFSMPDNPLLKKMYDLYMNTWPVLGKVLAGDADSYQYLHESIHMHPKPEEFKQMMEQAGFERVDYYQLMGGVSAIHRGFKI